MIIVSAPVQRIVFFGFFRLGLDLGLDLWSYWDGGLGLGLGLDNNQSINHQHRQHRTGQFTFHYIHNCLKYASFISNMYLVENNLFARLKAYSFNIPVILEVNLILSDSS